jgi:hypothetical protein
MVVLCCPKQRYCKSHGHFRGIFKCLFAPNLAIVNTALGARIQIQLNDMLHFYVHCHSDSVLFKFKFVKFKMVVNSLLYQLA